MTKDWNQPDDTFILVGGRGDAETLEQAAVSVAGGVPGREGADARPVQGRVRPIRSTSCSGSCSLLALSVIVALLGIVNTLALAVHERTRELGLLRAVGMSKRQVRRMVRAESVITALIGAMLGFVLGIVFAVIVSRPLAEDGFVLTFPIVTLIGLDGARRARGRAGGDPAGAAGGEGRRAACGDDGGSAVPSAFELDTPHGPARAHPHPVDEPARCWSSATARAAA